MLPPLFQSIINTNVLRVLLLLNRCFSSRKRFEKIYNALSIIHMPVKVDEQLAFKFSARNIQDLLYVQCFKNNVQYK